MKIYKFDIDASKPANQVVRMQQNSAGMLSIDVTNDGKYIRNLSCSVYDGGIEIPESKYGYKVNVGSAPKHITIEAKSQPYECSAQYILSAPPGVIARKVWCSKLQLKAGTYRQDEFTSLAQFGDDTGAKHVKDLSPNSNSLTKVNFSKISLMPWNPVRQVWFMHSDGSAFGPDELVVATEDADIGSLENFKSSSSQATLSATLYPAVGYYTSYQNDVLINPSENTAPYATIEYDPSEIEAGSISADAITLSGVNYIPTTLTVDGVQYRVLAAKATEG